MRTNGGLWSQAGAAVLWWLRLPPRITSEDYKVRNKAIHDNPTLRRAAPATPRVPSDGNGTAQPNTTRSPLLTQHDETRLLSALPSASTKNDQTPLAHREVESAEFQLSARLANSTLSPPPGARLLVAHARLSSPVGGALRRSCLKRRTAAGA